jgi:hypothetical protein
LDEYRYSEVLVEELVYEANSCNEAEVAKESCSNSKER